MLPARLIATLLATTYRPRILQMTRHRTPDRSVDATARLSPRATNIAIWRVPGHGGILYNEAAWSRTTSAWPRPLAVRSESAFGLRANGASSRLAYQPFLRSATHRASRRSWRHLFVPEERTDTFVQNARTGRDHLPSGPPLRGPTFR